MLAVTLTAAACLWVFCHAASEYQILNLYILIHFSKKRNRIFTGGGGHNEKQTHDLEAQ